MARIFIEGFESGCVNPGIWDIITGSTVDTSPALWGMSGNYYYKPGHDQGLVHIFKAADYTSDLYFSYRYFQSASRGGAILEVQNTAQQGHCSIYGHFNAYTSHMTVVIPGVTTYYGTISLSNLQPYRIEVRYKCHPSDGIIQVKVNGVLDINQTGVKTQGYTWNPSIDRFIIRGEGSSDGFDDIVVDDAAWVGNTRIQGITPSADVTCGWTAVPATNHYVNVNEIPWRSDSSDSEYIHVDTTGVIDLFTCTNLVDSTSQPIISVKSVQIATRAKLVGDATNVPHLKLGVQPAGSGTIYYSSNHNVQQDTWDTFTSIWSTNPAGGNWDMTTVNNMNIAIKSDG